MILVIDYGMGNLRSVSKALEHLGAQVKVSSEPSDIQSADKIVLPGVGAFGDAMAELKRFGLINPIKDAIQKKIPFLGICLGLQLLFPKSEESPKKTGLGIFTGEVKLFRSPNVKIPHMGWNSVKVVQKHPLLEGIEDKTFFYFVHSYYAVPKDNKLAALTCEYGEETFAAALGNDSVFATQFHPEKSQAAGLKILKNFISW